MSERNLHRLHCADEQRLRQSANEESCTLVAEVVTMSDVKKSVLVTDSLFIFEEHEQRFRDADISFVRLDKPEASEAELVEAIKDKHGYILGGVEHVTEAVINAANNLEVICFTGTDYLNYIPAHEQARLKGIAITNCPAGNASAVTEYTLGLMIAMTREMFDLGRTGTVGFKTTRSLFDMSIGIVGLGAIGEQVTRALLAMGITNISYFSRTRKDSLESELGVAYLPLDELLTNSDLVSLHVSKAAGDGYFGKEEFSQMKDSAILINTAFEASLDFDALFPELESGRLRVAHDGPVSDPRYRDLPLSVWFCSNLHTGYNTTEANKNISDMATESVLSVLTRS